MRTWDVPRVAGSTLSLPEEARSYSSGIVAGPPTAVVFLRSSSVVALESPAFASPLACAVWKNEKVGTGHARSALDSEQAWSASEFHM